MKKILPLIVFIFSAGFTSAQCTASFTYANVGNGTVNFTSTSVGTGTNTEYLWNFGDGATFSATNNILASHTYTANGNFTVNLYIQDSTLNCGSGSSVALVVANACTANASFSMQKDSTALPAIVWNAIPNYPGNITAANWIWGDGSNTNGLYPSHTYSAAATYDICLTITVSCGATATVCTSQNIYKMAGGQQNAIAVVNVVANPNSIEQIAKNAAPALLVPNPSNGQFEIVFGDTEIKNQIEITSIVGTKIFSASVDENTPSIKVNLDYPSGTYLLKINSAYKKLVIVK